MLKRFLLRIAILAFYILLLCWILRKQRWEQLLQLSSTGLLGSIAFIIVIFSISGLQYFFVLKRLGCRMMYADILFFPFMQAVCGIIIPLQGSTLFALIYLKMQYHVTVAKSMVMVMFLYLLNFLFAGVAGVLYSWKQHNFCSLLFLFSVLFLGMPLYLLVASRLLTRGGSLPFVPRKIQMYLRDFFQSLHILFADWWNLLEMIFCQLLRQTVTCGLLLWVARELDLSVSWMWGYLVVVSQELSMIFKCTPGNLGLSEMIAATISVLTGIPAAHGVIISLCITVMQLGVCITLGSIGIYLFLQRTALTAQSFRKMIHAETIK